MQEFTLIRNQEGDITHIETTLSGPALIMNPKLYKGCAFTTEERDVFHLQGLLPIRIETLNEQTIRMYAQYREQPTNLAKNIYLQVLHNYNETLFYRLVSQNLEEMLPIVYTPTVGEAVQRFSLQHRKAQGMYLAYPSQNNIERILQNRLPQDVDLIVVTDGEAVLGIGDQGIGGIKIANAKLMVYTLCGGINPHRVLPIQLDVGTNNPSLLSDPMYLGWRHERISGQAYDDFIEKFVQAIKKNFPHVFLHWEDVGRDNARRILTRYQNQLCTFNGDMQGTGSVTLACILAACAANKSPLSEQRIVIFGAGTAGVGIAEQIFDAMQRLGLSEKEAKSKIWMLDKQGLLINTDTTLLPFQQPYARDPAELAAWNDKEKIDLEAVTLNIKPTILIGSSAMPGAFTEKIIKTMTYHVKRPIIMPLSNPTSKAEATPDNLLKWSNGQAIIATGSPFSPIEFRNHSVRIAQSNNAFAFPGIGLGAIASRATRVTDDMIWAATETLSHCSPMILDSNAPLLPKLSEVRAISHKVGLAVAAQARREGLTQISDDMSLEKAIKLASWEPKYFPYKKS